MRESLQYKYVTILFLMMISYSSQAQDSKNFQWFQYYAKSEISEKLTWQFDGGFRFQDKFRDPSQYILRSSLQFAVFGKFKAAMGLAHLGFNNTEHWYRFEWRPYGELITSHRLQKMTLQHRLRMEFRSFREQALEGTNEIVISKKWRPRYRLLLSIPLEQVSKGLSMLLGDELLLHMEKEENGIIINQNRFLVGPKFQVNKEISFSMLLNYQRSYVAPSQFRNDYVFWLGINHTL